MPFLAKNKLGEEFCAWDHPERGEYFCPHCENPMVVVSSENVISHFRHKVKCKYETEPESEEHLYMKKFIFDELTKIGYKPKLEYRIGNRITDIYVEFNGIKGVIECQSSLISVQEIKERNHDYTFNDCYVMWVLGEKKYRNERIRKVEKYLKALYYGSFYCLCEGKVVLMRPYHLWRKTYFTWKRHDKDKPNYYFLRGKFNRGFANEHVHILPTNLLFFNFNQNEAISEPPEEIYV